MEHIRGLALQAVNVIGLLLVVAIWWYGAYCLYRDVGLGREFRSVMTMAGTGQDYVVEPAPFSSKRR